MIQSMTGFGSAEINTPVSGKISIELRSINHKSLEFIFRLPEGFLSLEDKIKKEIESGINRGRLTCSVLTGGPGYSRVYINQETLKNYLKDINGIKKKFKLANNVTLDTLLHLPGVIAVSDKGVSTDKIWLQLKPLIKKALAQLVSTRLKEGRALRSYLNVQLKDIKKDSEFVRTRYKKAVEAKLVSIASAEERSSFLKSSDIGEELERLSFHVKNFAGRIEKNGPCGKELDFIAQEMQRESNTMGAKSFDPLISAKVVQIKSRVEKIREQVQNIE